MMICVVGLNPMLGWADSASSTQPKSSAKPKPTVPKEGFVPLKFQRLSQHEAFRTPAERERFLDMVLEQTRRSSMGFEDPVVAVFDRNLDGRLNTAMVVLGTYKSQEHQLLPYAASIGLFFKGDPAPQDKEKRTKKDGITVVLDYLVPLATSDDPDHGVFHMELKRDVWQYFGMPLETNGNIWFERRPFAHVYKVGLQGCPTDKGESLSLEIPVGPGAAKRRKFQYDPVIRALVKHYAFEEIKDIMAKSYKPEELASLIRPPMTPAPANPSTYRYCYEAPDPLSCQLNERVGVSGYHVDLNGDQQSDIVAEIFATDPREDGFCFSGNEECIQYVVLLNHGADIWEKMFLGPTDCLVLGTPDSSGRRNVYTAFVELVWREGSYHLQPIRPNWAVR